MKTICAALGIVAALLIGQASATDFHSYGQWLDANMDTYRSINHRTGNVYFHERRETVWRHIDNGRSNAQVSLEGATFEGGVFGYSTGPGARDRVEGAIQILIDGGRFSATITGVPSFVDNAIGGDLVALNGRRIMQGSSFEGGAYTHLRGGFYGHHGNTAAGTLYAFDFDSAGEFHGVWEADR